MSEYESRYAPREFGGAYDDEDEKKMRRNQELVDRFLAQHPLIWLTPEQIRQGAGLSEHAEVQARIRCNRNKGKEKNLWAVDCKKIDGVYRYRYRKLGPQGELFAGEM